MISTIIIIALQLIGLGYVFAKHGQPKEGNYNGWFQLISFLIIMWLYYEAGLFDKLFVLFK